MQTQVPILIEPMCTFHLERQTNQYTIYLRFQGGIHAIKNNTAG